MKQISLYIFLCLLLKGCGEPATKIYPENGMFMDKNKTYDLSCYIEFGKDRDWVDVGQMDKYKNFLNKKI